MPACDLICKHFEVLYMSWNRARLPKTHTGHLWFSINPSVSADSHCQSTETWPVTHDFEALKVKHDQQPWPVTCPHGHTHIYGIYSMYVYMKCRHSFIGPSFCRRLLYCLWWWRATELLTRHIHQDAGRIIHHSLASANSSADWYIGRMLSLWQRQLGGGVVSVRWQAICHNQNSNQII